MDGIGKASIVVVLRQSAVYSTVKWRVEAGSRIRVMILLEMFLVVEVHAVVAIRTIRGKVTEAIAMLRKSLLVVDTFVQFRTERQMTVALQMFR